MRTLTKLGALTAASVGFAFALPLEDLRFGPESGSTLSKTYTTEFDMELDDLSLLVSGQDLGAMFEPSMSFAGSSEVSFTDEYGSISDGKPTRLTRTFDSLGLESSTSIEMMGESQEEGAEAVSPLDGLTVVFSWDEESGDYTAEFGEESTGDEELLEGLTEDTDLRWLLPEGGVAVDESWSFDPSQMEHLLFPSGDLGWAPEGAEDVDMEEFEELFEQFGDELMDSLDGLLDGEGTATFTGAREADGRTVGAIALEAEISSSADLASTIQDLIESAVSEAGEEVPDDLEIYVEAADVSIELEAQGELLWDMETGSAHSMTMDGEFEFTIDLIVSATAEGETQDLEVGMSMSGVMTAGLETSR